MNVHTGELRQWDDLTPEQQQSGEWIKLPPESDAGVAHARRRSFLDSIPVTKFTDVPRGLTAPRAPKGAPGHG